MARSERLLSLVAKKVWPQGRPFARYNSNEEVIVGNIFRQIDFEQNKFADPNLAGADLYEQQQVLEERRRPLDKVGKLTMLVAGGGVVKGIIDGSIREISVSILGGMSVWMGIQLIKEICDQSIDNLEDRMDLAGELFIAPHQE
jgi:hypothetical protein